MKKLLYLASCLLPATTVMSMNISKKQKDPFNLQKKDFAVLAKHSKNFIKNNIDNLAVQENESGFVRINTTVPDKYIKILDKARINYWPNKEKKSLDPETIHSHPLYFESILINGGYRHSIYEHNNDPKAPLYKKFTIFKQPNFKRKFIFLGTNHLSYKKKETKVAGDIARFQTSLIHRVEESDPLTMSLNVVERYKDNQSYNVYTSLKSDESSVKTTRSFLNDHDSKTVAKDIITKLNKFLNN